VALVNRVIHKNRNFVHFVVILNKFKKNGNKYTVVLFQSSSTKRAFQINVWGALFKQQEKGTVGLPSVFGCERQRRFFN
jgi:hypothetical protein